MSTTTVSRFARFGERNGRCRLSDSQVEAMRTLRASIAPTPSYRQLGAQFKVHFTLARKICVGVLRASAAGPISVQARPSDEPGRVPFDKSRLIRCEECGSQAHPSFVDQKRCFGCAV